MSIVVAGLILKAAPISLLERLTITEEMLPKALQQLGDYEHVLEAVVLSTCNRVEVYAAVSKFHGGVQDLRSFFSEFCHVAPEDFADHLYTYYDEAAARHLFRVAAGIDSMVIGESEILGQVRRAFQVATREGTAKRVLGAAFRHALHAGKCARAETAIGRNPASISSAAVDLARRAFGGGNLEGRRVVILGAGEMARLSARALADAGAREVTIVNRTEERGLDLARDFEARALPVAQLRDAISRSDILICSTTSPQAIVDVALLEEALRDRRREAPLFIVDIAVPRDVDPAVAALEGVVLRDIDDLRGVIETSMGSRLGEVSKVEAIIARELERFLQWERSSKIGTTLAALLEKGEAVRAREVDRLLDRRPAISEGDREAIERTTRRIVAKLLHEPMNRAKELASSKQGDLYLAALRELFELDDAPEP